MAQKYPCFVCLWDSRADHLHYTERDWPLRQALESGSHNVITHPSVNFDKIIFFSLHIKLELIRNLVKAMEKTGSGFAHLKETFSHVGEARLNVVIFDGRQIRDLM